MSDRNDADKSPDLEERIGELREGVESADATGLVAGAEMIARAESMLPPAQPAELPRAQLHAALPRGHAGHATVDDLHAEIERGAPDRGSIEGHVHRLRLLPELEATLTLWWDDPRTQRFIAGLGQIGV